MLPIEKTEEGAQCKSSYHRDVEQVGANMMKYFDFIVR